MDLWRILYPTEHSYSYYSKTHYLYFRLISIFMSHHYIHLLCSASIGISSLSDHALISNQIFILTFPSHTNYWKLNDSLLSDLPNQTQHSTAISGRAIKPQYMVNLWNWVPEKKRTQPMLSSFAQTSQRPRIFCSNGSKA